MYERVTGGEEDTGVERAVEELERGYLSAEQIGSKAKAHAADRRLVFWSTPTFEDRLFLWMVFDALRREEIPENRVATAEPTVPVSPQEEDFYALRDLQLEELVEGFDNLVYPKGIYIQAGADLWQTFSSASPRKFAISVPHTEKFFPQITTVAENYGWMFPVAEGEDADRLKLSEFDRELLGALGEGGWQTPFDVLGGEFVERFHFVDDLAVAARLHAWSDAGEEAAYLDRRPADRPAGLFERHEFRITDRATEMLDRGIREEDDVPILELGDCRIYASNNPWAKIVEGEHWWFERFELG